FVSKIRGKMVFPISIGGAEKPDLPDATDQVEDLADELYKNNEEEGEGGYYPVGPMGESRLWHGGIHVRAERGTAVYAPFQGKVVAARMTDDCPIGSRNFVLIKHELSVGAAQVKFW